MNVGGSPTAQPDPLGLTAALIGPRVILSDQAYVVLRDAIFEKRLPPGSRLSVPDMAERLGISRSPVREAVARLAHEGLVKMVPNKGGVVAELGIDDLLEIYELREILEGLAASLAAARVNDESLGQLRNLYERHVQVVEAGRTDEHMALDMAFHRLTRELTGNRRLLYTLDRLQGQIRLAMSTTQQSRGGMAQAVAEHQVILNALATRDPVRAENAAREHIRRLRRDLQVASRSDEPD